jgi:hypothetical protein
MLRFHHVEYPLLPKVLVCETREMRKMRMAVSKMSRRSPEAETEDRYQSWTRGSGNHHDEKRTSSEFPYPLDLLEVQPRSQDTPLRKSKLTINDSNTPRSGEVEQVPLCLRSRERTGGKNKKNTLSWPRRPWLGIWEQFCVEETGKPKIAKSDIHLASTLTRVCAKPPEENGETQIIELSTARISSPPVTIQHPQ